MITSVRMVNFKNFADETLTAGPFTIIVGANASGKSNIRDAFRFLHGIGRGYTLAQTMGGKDSPSGQKEWQGIRGAPCEVVRMGHQEFSLGVEASLWDTSLSYLVEVDHDFFNDGLFRVKREELFRGGSPQYGCYRDGKGLVLEVGDPEDRVYPMSSSDPFLSDVTPTYWPPGETIPIEDPAVHMKDALANILFLEPTPERMRESAFPGARLGKWGQNLPSALETICADSQRGRTLISWLQELTPMDVRDFDFPRDPADGSTSISSSRADARYHPTAPPTAPCAFSASWQHCWVPAKGTLLLRGDRQRHPPQPPLAPAGPHRAAGR